MRLTDKNLLLGVIWVICAALMPMPVMADSITADTFSAVIKKGGDVSVKRRVTITEEVTSAKVDIFFLFDTTGSMGDLLDSTKENATDILNNASGLGDVAFGVGYYEDFPVGSYGGRVDTSYELVRDITTSSSAAQNAINSLSLGYGGDWPEANLYALDKVATSTNWRENSTRIVIWFGDAVGHDGKLDPDYPGKVGLDDVVAALKDNDVIVEAIDVCSGTYYGLDRGYYYNRWKDYTLLSGQATEITSETGGKLFDGSDTDSIVTIINNALKDAFAEYSEVTLELSEEFSGLGVSISPPGYTGNFDRSRERYFDFDITYTGTETGTYKFDLLANVDGGVVAVAKDDIVVEDEGCGDCAPDDCNGDPGGTAYTDDCGECVGGDTGRDSTCVQDCNGDWGGTAVTDDCGQCVGGNTGKTACDNKGVFTVGGSGKVTIDWLYDGGAYDKGELGIFNLSGMDMSVPDLTAFITEAVTRAMSNTTEGYVVLSDSTEAARFDGSLGEPRNWNSGTYMGVRTFDMRPGDKFAIILVPNSSLRKLSENPGTTDKYTRPLFSFTTLNADYGMHVGQVADINDMGLAFVLEDLDYSESDLDYNDMILQISGGMAEVPSMDSLVGKSGARKKRDGRDSWRDWRTSDELGRLIVEHIETLPPAGYERVSVSLDGSADMTVFDSRNRAAGRDGADIPGSLIEFGDGYQTVTLPATGTGSDDYRVVVRSAGSGTGSLTLKRGHGNGEIPSETKAFDIGARQVLKSDLSVSQQPGDTVTDFGDVRIPAAKDGTPLAHDFNGDGRIGDDDISMVTSRWNTCDGESGYDPFFDRDGDGCITVLDIMAVSSGKHMP